MPTLIHRLNYDYAPAAGIPPLVSDIELALMKDARLLNWWRADTGLGAMGWECRKTGARLVPERTKMPKRQLIDAYSGKASLLFDAQSQLWDDGANLMPTGGALSLVLVGRAGPNDSAFLAGAASQTVTTTTALVHQSTAAASGTTRLSVNNDGGALGNYSVISTSERYYADGPMLMIGSHDPGGTPRMALRNDGGTVDDATANPPLGVNANAQPEFHVGGVNRYGSAIGGAIDGGDIAEVVIWNVALHVETAARDDVESYVNARYGLW